MRFAVVAIGSTLLTASCAVMLMVTPLPLQVTTPAGTFQPVVSSATKKLAKAQAALACLQALGLVEKSINYTTA